MRNAIKQFWLATALCLGLGACGGLTVGQRDAVAQFSSTAIAFADTVAAQMIEARGATIDLNTHVLGLAPRRIADRERMDGAFTPENVGARIQSAMVVRSYGDLLLALVLDAQEEQLRAAAERFTQSIRGLDRDQSALSDAELTAIGKAVAAIGGSWVEREKAAALGDIVPRVHPQVARIGELMASEFDPRGGAVARNLEATALLALRAAEEVLDRPQSSVADRAVAAAAYRRGIEVSRYANAVLPGMAEAAREMTKAHAALVEALAQGDIGRADVTAFVKRVQELIALARAFAD